MKENKNIFPEFKIIDPTRLLKTAKGFFTMHLLSNQSEHFKHDTDALLLSDSDNVIALPRQQEFKWPDDAA